MHIFITGATGWIGKPLVTSLISSGHTILGLSRSPSSSKILTDLGATPHPGSLSDLPSLQSGAKAVDAIIHLAFDHDFTNYQANCLKDCEAISAIGEVVKGTDKPFLIASGTLMLEQGVLATEESRPDLETPTGAARGKAELLTLELAKEGVRSMVVRLAPTNHGEGDLGFITSLVSIARKTGVSAYVGDGAHRWSAVHRLDTGSLFHLALEKGSSGAVYHAVAEESITIKEIAEVIGKNLNVPVASKTKEEAMQHFGFLGMVLAMDNPVSSEKTRRELGWEPKQKKLFEDMVENYFKEE